MHKIITSLIGAPTLLHAEFPPPSSSYTFPVEISYLTFCFPNLSSVRVLLFSLGVVLLLFELVNDPGFNGVQLVKFGWLIVAAGKYHFKLDMTFM